MDEFIGAVKLFAGKFAPQGFMYCAGQLLSIKDNPALYYILGTVYGGDGITTFALPDLRDRIPVGAGMGNGNVGLNLQPGQQGGEVSHTLTMSEIPQHIHFLKVSDANASLNKASADACIGAPGIQTGRDFNSSLGFNTEHPNVTLASSSVSAAGGSQAHNNMQPYTGLSYIICVTGVFPSQSE